MNIQTDPDSVSEWGPLGCPVFGDPEARALSRVGVVDVGSNSVRLVVFDGAARSPAYFYNEKIMCGLGQGLGDTGRLHPEGRARAINALERFQMLAAGMGLLELTVIATAAVRDAKDGTDFCAEVKKRTGLSITVIDGVEEARLSAQGVLLGWPGSYGLVCDIGGSSMELAEISDGQVGRRVTTDLGPLKLQDIKGGAKGRASLIRKRLADIQDAVGPQRDRLFLVGGSWRAIARIDMHRRGYPLQVLHEYRMTVEDVTKTIVFLHAHKDHNALRAACGISSSRMALVPYAADVLGALLGKLKPSDIAISAYGIREGLLYEQMPQSLRDRDPLIEACSFAEAKDARLPGFGRELYSFIKPIFADTPAERRRVIKAACLLHDVSWRAHPDYRAEVCFDNATRANLGGLKHSERVYLGLALLHRYSNKREGTAFEKVSDLLDEADQREAESVGKAMRFGAMLWTHPDADRGRFVWHEKRRALEFQLPQGSMALFGEVPSARLKSLGASLQAEVIVTRT